MEQERKSEGLPPEEFEDLMASVTRMAPLLKGFLGKGAGAPPPSGSGKGEGGGCHRREALLCSLKPYLSPEKCAAVDYLIRLARVGDAIRALQ